MASTTGKFTVAGLTCLLLLSSLAVTAMACPPPPPPDPEPNDITVGPPADGAEPVYLKTGEYHFSTRDFIIQGRVLPVQIVRTYGSQHEDNNKGFGYGWDMNYDVNVVEETSNYIALYDGQNRKLYYYASSGTTYFGPPGCHDYIIKNSGPTSYTLYKKHGTKWDFNFSGKLVKITDRTGTNFINFGYTSGKLTTITDDLNRVINLQYNGDGLLWKITDFANRTWTYIYNSSTKDLLTVTSPPDLPPFYVPTAIRELSTLCVLFGEGEGTDEAGAEAKSARWRTANAAGVT
jgi:YD repeat-containing protein